MLSTIGGTIFQNAILLQCKFHFGSLYLTRGGWTWIRRIILWLLKTADHLPKENPQFQTQQKNQLKEDQMHWHQRSKGFYEIRQTHQWKNNGVVCLASNQEADRFDNVQMAIITYDDQEIIHVLKQWEKPIGDD